MIKFGKEKKRKNKKFYILPKKSVRESYKSKINKVIKYIKKNNVDYQFISSSENNAWLFNMRGATPNILPFLIVMRFIEKIEK